MQRIKQVLLPLATALMVLGAIVLPGQLSHWKDQTQIKRIHREPSETDIHLPNYALSMEQRLDLLMREQNGDGVSSMMQTLIKEELQAADEAMWRELEAFENEGYIAQEYYQEIHRELTEEDALAFGSRMYLQDEQTRATTRVITYERLSKQSDIHLWITMDEETGRILVFEFTLPDLNLQKPMRAFAEFFMDRLGVTASCRWENKTGTAVEMQLNETNIYYNFNLSNFEWGILEGRPYREGAMEAPEGRAQAS